MKKIFVLCLVAVLLLLSGCSTSTVEGAGKEVEDAITNITDADNKYVQMVKGGYREGNPDLTYDDAFNAFFGTPRWKYFKGEDEQDVVEFTGDCTYQDTPVKARIQFVVDEENGTFEATYLAFNEVPQNMLMLSGLIETVFSEADESTDGNSSSPAVPSDTGVSEPPQEGQPSTATASDTVFETDYYTLTIPASWDGKYTYEQDGSNLTFYELESYNNGWGGKLFGISLREDEEFFDFPGYYSMGALVELNDGLAPGFLYYVVISTPTDVQFSDDAAETYTEMNNSIDSILASISVKGGYAIITD